MIRAVFFDCFGVLVTSQGVDARLAAVVRQLRGHVKLGILSNVNENIVPELLGDELAACFDVILVSGELGVAKPDQRAYLLAAQRVGEFAEDCLVIDDSERNVTGAQEVGMAAVVYEDPEKLVQKLTEYGIITA